MFSRIIENSHYAGDERYPAIIGKDIYEAAISRKNTIGGKREKDTAEIKYLKSVIYCSKCGELIHRSAKYSTRGELSTAMEKRRFLLFSLHPKFRPKLSPTQKM